MKKILFSLMAIALVVGLVGAGAFAYFSDTATSSGNQFTAGTLDLTKSAESSIALTGMAPGDTASGSITVTNAGSLSGSLYATSWYVTADGDPNPGQDMSDDDVAKMLLITAFTADANDILSQIPDVDSDGKATVYDMVNDPNGVTLADYPSSPGELATWYSYDATMAATASHTYAMTVQFDTAAGNDYQGDGITLTFEFLLTQ